MLGQDSYSLLVFFICIDMNDIDPLSRVLFEYFLLTCTSMELVDNCSGSFILSKYPIISVG